MKVKIVAFFFFLAGNFTVTSALDSDSVKVEDYIQFLKSDSLFSHKNIFVGEFHSDWAKNDFILKDILEKAKRKEDTLYLILELSPSEERLMNSYFTAGTDSLRYRLLMEDAYKFIDGWWLSKTNVLFQYFRQDILANTLIIKGIEPEHNFGLSLEYLYEICSPLNLNKENRTLLTKLYDKYEISGKMSFAEFMPLVLSIEKEFRDNNYYNQISDHNRAFLISDFEGMHQFDSIRVKEKGKRKQLYQKFMYNREKILVANFKKVQAMAGANKMVSMLGLMHVSKMPNTLEPRVPLIMMLKNENLIQDNYVIALLDQRKAKRMANHKTLSEPYKFLLNQRIAPYTVYHCLFQDRYFDSVYIFISEFIKF